MKGQGKYPTPRGPAANAAKARYNSATYDTFQVVVPKGKKDEITETAKRLGYKSRNEFVLAAINRLVQEGSSMLKEV